MHVLYECLGHPAELDLVSHIRALVDAALFLDDEDTLTNALHIVQDLDGWLGIIRTEALADTARVKYIDGSADVSEWDSLEEAYATFDSFQRTLGVAEFKLKAALRALDGDSVDVPSDDC